MDKHVAGLLAFVAGCVIAVGSFLVVVTIMSSTGCPPETVCDGPGPPHAAIGLGIIIAPLAFTGAVWLTYRLLTRSSTQRNP
jgi:hypothetical protein